MNAAKHEGTFSRVCSSTLLKGLTIVNPFTSKGPDTEQLWRMRTAVDTMCVRALKHQQMEVQVIMKREDVWTWMSEWEETGRKQSQCKAKPETQSEINFSYFPWYCWEMWCIISAKKRCHRQLRMQIICCFWCCWLGINVREVSTLFFKWILWDFIIMIWVQVGSQCLICAPNGAAPSLCCTGPTSTVQHCEPIRQSCCYHSLNKPIPLCMHKDRCTTFVDRHEKNC